MTKFFGFLLFGVSALVLTACDQTSFPLKNTLTSLLPKTVSLDKKPDELRPLADLDALIKGSRSKVDVDAGFMNAVFQALDQDPDVRAAKNKVTVQKEKLRTTEVGRDTQFRARVLGGIEDVSDKTVGVAAILTADRVLYDGGILDAKIDAEMFRLKAVEQAYLAARGSRALSLSHAWIELERFQALKELIDNRLTVLDPLLVQLEKVATAGVVDVSQVAEAQRIVSMILVAATSVTEKYEQSKIAFENGFGKLPVKARYDASFLSMQLPTSSVNQVIKNSPVLMSKYWAYRAAEASVVAIKAQDNFTVGFGAKIQQPFGGSGSSSDEVIGLTLSKDFYRGDQLQSQVRSAEASALASASQVTAAYRESEFRILAARKMIKSMDKTIELAKNNVKSSLEEIEYLRKQLIIGGSTLASVLTAEARLYEAESKEIGFVAERRKGESTILAVSGYFSRTQGSN